MNYKEFLKDLKEERLKPVYLLYGREKYLMNHLIKKIKERYIDPNFESLNYLAVDGSDLNFDEIKNAAETLPFMAEKKVVIVEDWKAFGKKKDGDVSGSEEKEFLDYIPTIGNSSLLLFIINAEKVDNRRKIIKQIGNIGGIVELNRLSETELSNWISNKFKKRDKEISRREINDFVQYTGYLDKEADINLNNLENEIEKLISYTGDREKITADDLNEVVSKSIQSNIFHLVELLGQKNASKSIDRLNELLNLGIPTQKILYMIIRQIRLLLMTNSYMERGYSQKNIKDLLGIKFDFILNKLIMQSKMFNREKLIKALEMSLELDRDIKTSSIDDRVGIERLLMELSI